MRSEFLNEYYFEKVEVVSYSVKLPEKKWLIRNNTMLTPFLMVQNYTCTDIKSPCKINQQIPKFFN